MPFPCRAHAVPLPCRAAKGLECVFPIWFTQCGRVWFTLCHAAPMPFSRPRHSMAVDRRPVGELPALGFFRLSRGLPRSYQTHTNLRCRWPVWNQTPFIMDEEKSCSSTLQNDDLLDCWTSSRIFPATMRTFTKDMALSEQGRGAAWRVN